MLPFHKVVEDDFAAVNTMVVDRLHSNVELVGSIGNYIIEGGGKRLRPVSVLLSALACGYQGQAHIKLASIIEFIHTATLLHDDVVDTSDLRRGQPTANAKWGNSPTVLVGDFLYSRAFQLLVELGDMNIMRLMADTTNMIAEGEVQQLVNAGNPETTEAMYREVIKNKTAILFEAATQAAAIVAGAAPTQISALQTYGLHLGMAFQLQDDVLDYQGDAEAMGKNVGDDLAEGKPTLPLIYTIAEGTTHDSELIVDAIQHANVDLLSEVVAAVQRSGGIEYTLHAAKAESDKAVAAAQSLPESIYRTTLIQLAEFAISRKF